MRRREAGCTECSIESCIRVRTRGARRGGGWAEGLRCGPSTTATARGALGCDCSGDSAGQRWRSRCSAQKRKATEPGGIKTNEFLTYFLNWIAMHTVRVGGAGMAGELRRGGGRGGCRGSCLLWMVPIGVVRSHTGPAARFCNLEWVKGLRRLKREVPYKRHNFCRGFVFGEVLL